MMRPPVFLASVFLVSTLFASEVRLSRPDVLRLHVDWRASSPHVAAGEGFLVTWGETFFAGYPGAVRLRTYDAEGRPLQVTPIEISESGYTPHAFWNGEEWVVVWAKAISRFGTSDPVPVIVATRVRADGTVVESSTVTLAQSRTGGGVIDVAWDGTNALALVGLQGAYRALRLDRDGQLAEDTALDYIPAAVTALPGGGFFVLSADRGDAVTASGDRIAVIDRAENSVVATILDRAGVELERFTLASHAANSTAVVWDGQAFVAVYADAFELCTARFTTSANVVRECEERHGVTSATLAAGNRQIFRAWLSSRDVITDGGVASTRLSNAFAADAVVDDAGLFAAWLETTQDGVRIHVGGLANDGTPRAEKVLPGFSSQGRPALSRAGNRTLLAALEGDHLRLFLFNATGALVSDRIHSVAPVGLPSLASRGDTSVMVWQGPRGIESATVDSQLQLDNRQDYAGSGVQEWPTVAATATGYLLVWREVEGEVVRVVAEPLDASGRRTSGGIRVVESAGPVNFPSIGCGPGSCLVTWYGREGELWSKLLRHDGTPFTSDRLFDAHTKEGDAPVPPRDTVIVPQADGSFRVYRGGAITQISATGEPGPTLVWREGALRAGAVVTFRGRTTVVYDRDDGTTTQVYAQSFGDRARAVRH